MARPTGQQHRDAALWCFPLLSIAFDLPLPQSLPSLPDLESLPGAGREKASLRLQRMSFALKTMGGATVGSAITTAGLGDWETGNTLNLNGDSQRFRARLDSTCGENWQVPSLSWFAGPTVFEVCSSLCSLMFTVLFCEIHGVPLEFQGHVIAYVIHRVLLRRIFAVLGLLYPHHFCQAWRHVLHCYVSCLTCLLKSWETVHPGGLLAGRKYFVTDCKMISSIHRFLEISRVNFIQVSHIMFQHIATKYVAMLDGTYMTVASVASVACHQDGFNSVCTLPAGCIFDDTSLGDMKPVVLPCCPCHGGAAQRTLSVGPVRPGLCNRCYNQSAQQQTQCSATVLHTGLRSAQLVHVGPKTSQVTWRPSGALTVTLDVTWCDRCRLGTCRNLMLLLDP